MRVENASWLGSAVWGEASQDAMLETDTRGMSPFARRLRV